MPLFRRHQSNEMNNKQLSKQDTSLTYRQRPAQNHQPQIHDGNKINKANQRNIQAEREQQQSITSRVMANPLTKKPKLVFNTQLAHGSSVCKIDGFASIRELYTKLSDAFKVERKDILFCTLNTAKVDMDKLLGGQIGLDDIIFVHIKGNYKKISLLKSSPAIGLTITDNGDGLAFVKRVKESSLAHATGSILPGDHIQAVNAQNMIGRRHYDVARYLKELQIGQELTLELIEPKRGLGAIAPRGATAISKPVTSGKATLRLRAQGPAVVEAVSEENSWEAIAMHKIDDILEEFMGIRDQQLADTIVIIGKDKNNPSEFVSSLDDDEYLKLFNFPDHIIFDMWAAIGDAKSGRLGPPR